MLIVSPWDRILSKFGLNITRFEHCWCRTAFSPFLCQNLGRRQEKFHFTSNYPSLHKFTGLINLTESWKFTAPQLPPRNPQCLALTSHSIQLSWLHPAQSNGPINSYKVLFYPLEFNAQNNSKCRRGPNSVFLCVSFLSKSWLWLNYQFCGRRVWRGNA